MDAPVASFETLHWCSHGETDSYTNTADKAVAVPALIKSKPEAIPLALVSWFLLLLFDRLLCVCMTFVVHSVDTHTTVNRTPVKILVNMNR